MAVIDTTSAQYQQYLTGLTSLIGFYAPLMPTFFKMAKSQQVDWLQRDPLLRKFMKASLSLYQMAQEHFEEIKND